MLIGHTRQEHGQLYRELMMLKANIHLHVTDLTLEDLVALRQKVQAFLDAEVRALLLTFSATEEN